MRLHNMTAPILVSCIFLLKPSIKAIGLLSIICNIAAMGECQRGFGDSMGFDLIVTNGIIVSNKYPSAVLLRSMLWAYSVVLCEQMAKFCKCNLSCQKSVVDHN
jgi:hypothetical protein